MFGLADRPRVLIIVIAAMAAVSAARTVPASAAAGSTVVGVASGRCLDVIGNVQTTGTGVNIYDCNGQANQAWTSTPAAT